MSSDDDDPVHAKITGGLRVMQQSGASEAMRLVQDGSLGRNDYQKFGLIPNLVKLGENGTLAHLKGLHKDNRRKWRSEIIAALRALPASA